MVSVWQAGVNYGLNDVVQHNGKTYKIRQPHTSQADWEPQMTPALWFVVPDQVQGHSQNQQQQPQTTPQYQQQPPPSYPSHVQHQTPQGHEQKQEHHQQEQHHQEQEEDKNFFEKMTDKLGVGGTVAAGVGLAAVVGGGIALAVNHSKKDKDDDKL
jgi:hypothetical protein